MANGFAFGLDIGKPGEFSGLALVERTIPETEDAESHYTVQFLKRFAPGTSYKAMATDLDGRRNRLFGDQVNPYPLRDAPVGIDIGATGREVLDTFRIGDNPPQLIPASITEGLGDGCDSQGISRTARRNRITQLNVLFAAKRLTIPEILSHGKLLVKELANYRLKNPTGTDTAQADWRDGQADDLVHAVALAVWQADQLSEGPEDLPQIGMRMQNSLADRCSLEGRIRAKFPGRFARR